MLVRRKTGRQDSPENVRGLQVSPRRSGRQVARPQSCSTLPSNCLPSGSVPLSSLSGASSVSPGGLPATGQPPDDELIAHTLQGDTSAFGVLVVRYQDRLFNTVVHLVGSPESARDVVQDAFVQAFVKLHTFRRDSAFYTWMYRIAVNLAIGWRRKEKNCRSLDQLPGGLAERGGSDGLTRASDKERAAVVRAAVDCLHDEHRTVLVLREFEGYCYEEIAAILEVPVGTVRSRLHRARSQLREDLLDKLAGEIELCPNPLTTNCSTPTSTANWPAKPGRRSATPSRGD